MPFEEILGAVNGLHISCGSASQDHTEAGVAKEHKRILRVKVGHPEARDHERGLTTKEELTDIRGRGRGDGDRNDGTDAYLVKYELKGEEDSPYGGVECGCNSGAGARRDQGNSLALWHSYELAKGGA